jgi:hypothetical protein
MMDLTRVVYKSCGPPFPPPQHLTVAKGGFIANGWFRGLRACSASCIISSAAPMVGHQRSFLSHSIPSPGRDEVSIDAYWVGMKAVLLRLCCLLMTDRVCHGINPEPPTCFNVSPVCGTSLLLSLTTRGQGLVCGGGGEGEGGGQGDQGSKAVRRRLGP